MSVNNFDVLKAMGARNGKIQLAPLGNITNMKKVKAGTQLTIGVGGDVIFGLMEGKYVGGLILADKEEFEAVARELSGLSNHTCRYCGMPRMNCDCMPEV